MNTLLNTHIFETLAISAIFLRRSEGGALGMGSSGKRSSMFAARGPANLLTRVTAVLAALFMGNRLIMAVITSRPIKNEMKVVSQTPS